MMKLRLFSVLCAVSLLVLASCRDHLTGPPNTTVASDTIAYWTFDGNLRDITGNGHDGVSPLPSYGPNRFGNPSSAFTFTANANQEPETITVPKTSDLSFTANDSYSISAWVNVSGADSTVICSRNMLPMYDQTSFGIGVVDGRFFANVLGSSTSGVGLIASFKVSLGEWHTVTLVVAAHSSVTLYVDSVVAAIQPNTIDSMMWPSQNIPFVLGPIVDPPVSLDNILIMHHAMSASEVDARFHEGGWYEHTDTVVTPPPPATDTAWTPMNSGTSEDLVVGQFVNSATGFVSGKAGVFLATADTGSAWSSRSSAPVFSGTVAGSIYGLAFFNDQHGIAAGDQRDISMTSDGGQTWAGMDASNVPQSDVIRSLTFRDQTTGFLGTTEAFANPSGSICETTDGGHTWNPIFYTNGGIYDIDFIPGTNSMEGVALGRFGVAYWTSDGGTSWQAGTTDKPSGLISRTTFINPMTGFACGTNVSDTNGFILRTDDAGHTWRTVTMTNFSLNAIASNGAGTITAVGNGGVVIESTDGGQDWTKSFAGSTRWLDIRYPTQHRALLFGTNGAIDVREK